VDRTESTLPLGGLPALGGQLLVALDREGHVAASPEVFDDVEVQAVPEVPGVAGAGQLPRGPRGDLLVGAAHRLLEEAGDDVPAVPAVGLVRLLRLAEVVVAGRVRRRVGLKLPSDPNVACRSSPSAIPPLRRERLKNPRGVCRSHRSSTTA